jgi:hypothetical protein
MELMTVRVQARRSRGAQWNTWAGVTRVVAEADVIRLYLGQWGHVSILRRDIGAIEMEADG